jgi:type I restriction enzyme S subunit
MLEATPSHGFTPGELRRYLKMELTKGTTQKFIPLGHLRILPIPLPSLSEQKVIIEEINRLFSIVDDSGFVLESELKRAQSLRQSILKRAFEGKLVPQNPSDEPAAILLERIKAEKAKPKKSKQMEMF